MDRRQRTIAEVRIRRTPHALLILPVFTNSQAWTRAFFVTVAHQPISQGDLLRPNPRMVAFPDEPARTIDRLPDHTVSTWTDGARLH